MTARLERLVDELIAQRPLRPVFVVPGANTSDVLYVLARQAAGDHEEPVSHSGAPDP